jgi:hypothetical protein
LLQPLLLDCVFFPLSSDGMTNPIGRSAADWQGVVQGLALDGNDAMAALVSG